MSDDRLSIAELQRGWVRSGDGPQCPSAGAMAILAAAPVLLEIVVAVMAWKAMQERKLAHLYEPEEQALFDAVSKVCP